MFDPSHSEIIVPEAGPDVRIIYDTYLRTTMDQRFSLSVYLDLKPHQLFIIHFSPNISG